MLCLYVFVFGLFFCLKVAFFGVSGFVLFWFWFRVCFCLVFVLVFRICFVCVLLLVFLLGLLFHVNVVLL